MIATTLALTLALTSSGAAADPPLPPVVVQIHTAEGDITVALDVEQAPVSTCNFVRYLRAGRYRDARFFRTVVAETNDNPNPIDVIQAETTAGSDDPGFGPILLERTRDTGLSHRAGTISMARDGADTATSSFFIVVEDAPALDFGGGRHADGQGFAAFGQVTQGLDLVRAIQSRPATEEQLNTPVLISDIELLSPVSAVCDAASPE